VARKAPEPGLQFRKLADKSEGERHVRYLARNVEVDEAGNALIDPGQVERILFNPATPELEHEPWPSAGFAIEGEPPKRCTISTAKVAELRAEGFVEVEGEETVHRPGGPASNPWAVTHTFVQVKAIVFRTVDGDVRYRVTRQPDKDGEAGDPDAEVRWFYELELEA
jgi:hypothetical protein